MTVTAPQAVRNTHAWFERHSGWAPPDPGALREWMADGVCRCPDECVVAPAEPCAHGLASWWLVLRSLDRASNAAAMPPERLVPHPDRLDPSTPDFVPVMDAHYRAVEAGDALYADPASGLMAQTARALWDRGSCCEQGCRHCPYLDR